MILAYHKVDVEARTHFWVSIDAFDRQMADLQAYEVVYLDDYDPARGDQAVITFDGVYSNVARCALPILRKWGYPFELFVIGDWVGRDNTFDQHVEPSARFASVEELDALCAAGGRVQWHTRTHGRLADLDPDALALELTPPDPLRERFKDRNLRWFAYPHGEHAPHVRDALPARFDGAVSVDQGSNDRFALPRREVAESHCLSRSTVTVVVANYNYGRFLPQAMESVLRQSGRINEIVIIDDGSDDGSQAIVERYRDSARLIFNERNLGIVPTFRKAVEHTSTDYVVFLGADNRMRSDFVERTKAALDANPDAALVYTDMVIFGPRAGLLASKVGAEPTLADDVYHWRFPDPTPERLASLTQENFVHGSSMYRRFDYDRAGGYRESERPEDHDLFARMLSSGRRAIRVAEPLLEYRQHSGEQANTLLGVQLEVAYWTSEANRVKEALAFTESELTSVRHDLEEQLTSLKRHINEQEAVLRLNRGQRDSLRTQADSLRFALHAQQQLASQLSLDVAAATELGARLVADAAAQQRGIAELQLRATVGPSVGKEPASPRRLARQSVRRLVGILQNPLRAVRRVRRLVPWS